MSVTVDCIEIESTSLKENFFVDTFFIRDIHISTLGG